MSIFDQLPDRGWGVIRGVPAHLVMAYWMAGWIKVQVVPHTPGVFQARVTGEGRHVRTPVRPGTSGP